jgi:hypothetical protein
MRQRDVRYSYYDAQGNDSPTWKGKPIVEMLKAVVSDAGTTAEQKDDATRLLGYINRKQKAAAHLPELDQQVCRMLAEGDARAVWEWPGKWEIAIVKDQECVQPIEPEVVTAPTKPAPEPTEVEPERESDEPLTGAQKLAAAKEWAKTLRTDAASNTIRIYS